MLGESCWPKTIQTLAPGRKNQFAVKLLQNSAASTDMRIFLEQKSPNSLSSARRRPKIFSRPPPPNTRTPLSSCMPPKVSSDQVAGKVIAMLVIVRVFGPPTSRKTTNMTHCQNTASNVLAFHRPLSQMLLISMLVLGSTGCSMLNTPEMPSLAGADLLSPGFLKSDAGSAYRMADGSSHSPMTGGGSMSMEAYQRIKQAKEQNAIVLQVSGDEAPIRVLPLPNGKSSVFVSELLTQTGLQSKFGAVNATVYRAAPDSIAGIRMDVKMSSDGTIEPSYDYALRAGDRIEVSQRVTSGLSSLVDMALRR